MKRIRSCGFCIWTPGPPRRFLLMQHADRWDLPKGHVDSGETDMECALRELLEETGIPLEALSVDSDFRFEIEYQVQYRGKSPGWKTLVIFLAELTVDCPIIPTEHSGSQWFDWAPPHQIQDETIDPLLAAIGSHWGSLEPSADENS
jgi:bis(5'-nucleosidyl)-tetraphosphatase